MNDLLLRSVRVYQKLLLLYPEDLRRDFGNEMVLAFAEDLQQAWGDARWAGAIQIWWYATRELLTIALPGQRSNPYVLSPAVAFAVAAIAESTLLWLTTHPSSHFAARPVTGSDLLAVFSVSFLNAITAFVVTCFYARHSMDLVRLMEHHAGNRN